MHIAPAFRRWGARLGLSIIVAIGIGYVPAQVLRRDPRSAMLQGQLDQLDAEGKQLAVENAALSQDIEALRNDIRAIEDRARADLGMVYPDEIVFRVDRSEATP